MWGCRCKPKPTKTPEFTTTTKDVYALSYAVLNLRETKRFDTLEEAWAHWTKISKPQDMGHYQVAQPFFFLSIKLQKETTRNFANEYTDA